MAREHACVLMRFSTVHVASFHLQNRIHLSTSLFPPAAWPGPHQGTTVCPPNSLSPLVCPLSYKLYTNDLVPWLLGKWESTSAGEISGCDLF